MLKGKGCLVHLVILHSISSVAPSLYLVATCKFDTGGFFGTHGLARPWPDSCQHRSYQEGAPKKKLPCIFSPIYLRALQEVAGNKFEVVFLRELPVVEDSSRHNVRAAAALCLRDVRHLFKQESEALKCVVLSPSVMVFSQKTLTFICILSLWLDLQMCLDFHLSR